MPFFKLNSSVHDFKDGDITTPFTAVLAADISLVMYYAPWDFDSQMVRQELEIVANKLKDQVTSSSSLISPPN